MIVFGSELHNYQTARRKEFLLMAGGSYCSQTLAGNTRKYHGLLVHRGRVVFSTCDEFLNGKRLSVAAYGGFIEDTGLRYLQSIRLYPLRFVYEVDGVVLQKTLEFDGALHLRYELFGDAKLCVIPLVTDRSIHETRHNLEIRGKADATGITFNHLFINGEGCNFVERPDTYWNLWYEEDFARGYAHTENLHSPGSFEASGENITVSLHGTVPDPVSSQDREKIETPQNPIQCLSHAADDFVVGDAILAGYHWFPEPWGRDTFVSLPGLLLERGKFREAEAVFRFFARRCRKGLILNHFPDDYNSSDATLWFVHALEQYCQYGGRNTFLQEMLPVLEGIMSEYGESGVASLERDLIHVTPQSTWMDTRYTPREGKPVEVNALWVNAVLFAARLKLDPPVDPVQVRSAFSRFWNEDKGYLSDRIDPLDLSLRPNQVIALALGIVDPNLGRKALAILHHRLLTPYGLRTLASDEPGYQGRYQGDAGYHNGSVWPWLLGPFIDAEVRYGTDPYSLTLLLHPLLAHLHDAGLGTISEYFDGDPPYEPRGCIAQAWSVAEVFRSCQILDREMRKKGTRGNTDPCA
ncbi:MAG: amylo-alpha-1,6-glucosidase [Methanomicrobiales archaeon]|nr:amylo-alpha-1,6-glucosidase [Methanomicrobiales archaeon]